jgi:tRNA nucleotidyltransferase (CCA-adding enzyme)
MTTKFYLVGGAVRDKYMGLKPKDLDYACEAPSYEAMRDEIVQRGGQIFLETPKYFTIRAKVDGLGAADFVLCRKDGQYKDGRHPETVEVGTLRDDLSRRDFTMNAMAEDENGVLIDPFNGMNHMLERNLVCVGSAYQRFEEDALRLLRAVRFAVTKQMRLDRGIAACLQNPHLVDMLNKVSVERCREELMKAFAYDTLTTLDMLYSFPLLKRVFESGRLYLTPTLRNV